MKKLLFLVVCVFSTLTTSASHLMGGYIQAVQRNLSDTVDLQVVLYSDPNGISSPTTLYLNEYKIVNGAYTTSGNVTLSQTSSTTWQGFNVYIYNTTITRNAGNYRWVYTNCCRGMLSNASSAMNSNFTIGLDYRKTAVGVPNSAPILLNQLPMKWVVNDTTQTFIFAYDVDGDSVIVEKDDALNQYSTTGTFVPLSPFSQLDNYGTYYVDVSGLVIWGPTSSGVYGTGYKISEYRNGSLIGVNRIQQVYSVVPGSTPSIPSPAVQVNHDLVNGDSTIITINGVSNATTTELFVENVDMTQTSDSTWSLNNLQIGTYRALSRVTNGTAVMDYPFTFKVVSTIGIEENVKYQSTSYKVYDWNGRYIGTDLRNLRGLYIVRYDNGISEKIFIQ